MLMYLKQFEIVILNSVYFLTKYPLCKQRDKHLLRQHGLQECT